MKTYIMIKEETSIKKQMNDWYVKRTNRHIALVRKYCQKLLDHDSIRFVGLEDRMKSHDESKFHPPEKDAYIFISWKYKCKQEGMDFSKCNPPKNIDELMNIASHHHVTSNSHHPEYHSPRKTNLLNRDDRDKPPTDIVDATAMSNLDIAEMVCDWSSMSEELGHDSPRKWADDNVNVRWKFAKKQVDLIYEIINILWK